MTAKPESRPLGGGFVDATDKIDALLAQPEIAAFIEAERPARAAMNAAFALNLAKVAVCIRLVLWELHAPTAP